MKKNKICLLILAMFLALPIYSEEQDTAIVEQLPVAEETVLQEETVPEENLMENQMKKPVSKKKIAKKFLKAMAGVGVSSFLIYFGLTLYNRFRDGVMTANVQEFPEGDKSLDTPENLSEAVKIFIEKTKWE